YTPNDAALRNYPAAAPCGAYGNRNFFATYQQWFGTPHLDAGLYRIGSNSTWWLISGAQRWRIGPNDTELKAAVAPLGEPTSIELGTMTRFSNAGDFSGVVKSPSDSRYFILADGVRIDIPHCSDLQEFGYACAGHPSLPWAELKKA